MIFSLLAVRDVSLEFHTVFSPPSRTMATFVRDDRQNVFDDDEVRHVERRKEEVCRVAHNIRLLLFSREITFVNRNIELGGFFFL